MSAVPWYFWLGVGLAGVFAYSVGHRRAATAQQLALQHQETEIPLQPFTQPQPMPSAWPAYGPVPLGQDATTSTAAGFRYAYTSQIGQLA